MTWHPFEASGGVQNSEFLYTLTEGNPVEKVLCAARTRSAIRNRLLPAQLLEQLAESVIGNDVTAPGAVVGVVFRVAVFEERPDFGVVVQIGAGQPLELLHFVVPDAGVVVGMPLEVKDVVEPLAPDNAESVGDFADALPVSASSPS